MSERKSFKTKGYGSLLAVELAEHIDPIEFLNRLEVAVLATSWR